MEILEENFDEATPNVNEELKTPKNVEESKLVNKPSLNKA